MNEVGEGCLGCFLLTYLVLKLVLWSISFLLFSFVQGTARIILASPCAEGKCDTPGISWHGKRE